MNEVVLLSIAVVVIGVGWLITAAVCGFLAVRVRSLHESCHAHRNAADKASREYRASYMEQGRGMEALTREAVTAITSITHMMEAVVRGTENGTRDLASDFSKMETRVDSWMQTINQILMRIETKTQIFNSNSQGDGQVNQGGQVRDPSNKI